MTDKKRRIGLLTGGGDCPGLNAVIRAAFRAATLRHGFEVVGIEDGFLGLIRYAPGSKAGWRVLSADCVRGILPRGGTILGTSNKADPFRFAEPGPDGRMIEKDVSDRVVRACADLGLHALICVGGDGTMEIAHKLAKQGVRVVGVPKTIDNDLSATDFTFGFDTAVGTAVDAIDRLHTTAESHDRVMFLEVMGRHAGWIALHAGVAGGADVILIPEIPYSVAAIGAAIERRKAAGRTFGIIVVAEGARPLGGAESYAAAALPGQVARLGGAAERAAEALCQQINLDYRVTVLGHVQRGGSPSPVDRVLGTRFGAAAVDLVAREVFDHMVCLRTPDIRAVPLAEAVARPNRVDPQGQLVGCARDIGVSFGSPDEISG